MKKHPLIAEAYFLDYSGVDVGRGLILEAGSEASTRLLSDSARIRTPFDQWAMVWLLARSRTAEGENPDGFSPKSVAESKVAMDEHLRTFELMGNAMNKILECKITKPASPALFQFWLACEKERCQKAIHEAADSMPPNEKNDLENTIAILKDTPSKADAAQAVRTQVASDRSFWRYFGKEFEAPLKRAFEDAAH